MKAFRISTFAFLLGFSACTLLLSQRLVLADEPGYSLVWWTVDGGGGSTGSGSDYSLNGTAGQPDAALWAGGGYKLFGGFALGVVVVDHNIYLPLILQHKY